MPCILFVFPTISGKLDKGGVMKAICSGFEETTDPPVCLSEGIVSNMSSETGNCFCLVYFAIGMLILVPDLNSAVGLTVWNYKSLSC